MTDHALTVEDRADGRVRTITMARGKGNVLDRALMAELEAAIAKPATLALRAIRIASAGPHFSFGASIEEHLPGEVERMLPAMHRLIRAVASAPALTIACVRGRCLGGGLELALACDRIVASPDAALGQPEIKLAVFAPVASVLLPLRVGPARATELLVSGRSIPGAEAAAIGLVDAVAGDPEGAAEGYADRQLGAKSAAALRFALRAVRIGKLRALAEDLDVVERLYLDGLMATRDAKEGLRAFLEKRPPRFEDR